MNPKPATRALDVVDSLEIKPATATVAAHLENPLPDRMAKVLLDDRHALWRVGDRRQASGILRVILARARRRRRVGEVS